MLYTRKLTGMPTDAQLGSSCPWRPLGPKRSQACRAEPALEGLGAKATFLEKAEGPPGRRRVAGIEGAQGSQGSRRGT